MKTTGTRTGKKAILDGLGEKNKHPPGEYLIQLHLTFESSDERYSWLNSIVATASYARNGRQLFIMLIKFCRRRVGSHELTNYFLFSWDLQLSAMGIDSLDSLLLLLIHLGTIMDPQHESKQG